MKKTFAFLAVFSCSLLSSGYAEDYTLTINGASQDINLNQQKKLQLPDGTSLTVELKQKEYLRYASTLFSFEHHNQFKPNQSRVSDGLQQTMIVTPLGTGIIIQEYSEMNPSSLVDTMLNELTKEEKEYGYKYAEKPVKKQVGTHELAGKEAVTTYPGEEWTRSVLTFGKKDKGVLIVTFIEKDNYKTDIDLINHLWKTLELTVNTK